MGQKVNPHGLRVGIIKDWDSRWFAEKQTFGDTLVEDYRVREYLKKNLAAAGVPKIEIERDAVRVRVNIHCARPGLVIGKAGADIDKLRVKLEKMVGKPVIVNIVEVRQPDMSAQLVAESVAQQLERRIAFRRAMKQAIGRTMRLGARGIKIRCAGRLNGAEIARSEVYHEGTIPLHTLRADIDYGFAEAKTTYGRIGVKVFIYKGEVLKGQIQTAPKLPEERRPDDRDRRRPRDRNDRRPGDRNGAPRSGGYSGAPRTGAPRPGGTGTPRSEGGNR